MFLAELEILTTTIQKCDKQSLTLFREPNKKTTTIRSLEMIVSRSIKRWQWKFANTKRNRKLRYSLDYGEKLKIKTWTFITTKDNRESEIEKKEREQKISMNDVKTYPKAKRDWMFWNEWCKSKCHPKLEAWAGRWMKQRSRREGEREIETHTRIYMTGVGGWKGWMGIKGRGLNFAYLSSKVWQNQWPNSAYTFSPLLFAISVSSPFLLRIYHLTHLT